MILPEDSQPSDEFEVWPENWDAVQMWCRVQTQWRLSMSGPVGLDYAVLQWLFTVYDVKDPRSLLEDLRVMEGAALAVMLEEA